jgi:hypothetical protein
MTISQTTTDLRLISAREFLTGARKRKVAELPPSLLMRECAELRRQLGQVLDVVDGAAGGLGLALADAITYREPSGYCLDCVEHPAGLCADDAADLDRCDDYLHLARELGIEVGAEPQLAPEAREGEPMCRVRCASPAYVCTAVAGHSGDHVAWDSEHVAQFTWPQYVAGDR